MFYFYFSHYVFLLINQENDEYKNPDYLFEETKSNFPFFACQENPMQFEKNKEGLSNKLFNHLKEGNFNAGLMINLKKKYQI